mmetsp:Transcript_7741/g.21724  ORF Transcript_7741/g.21724 Transcript_7741/m.21724 type:complete len:146 (+) Transcript_7741:336-773(+)
MTSSALDSLRIVLWAQSLGRNEEFMAALGWRHFGHSARLADHSVIADAAEEAGLDRATALNLLDSDAYLLELSETMENFARFLVIDTSSTVGGIPMLRFRTTNPRFKEDPPLLQGSQPQQTVERVLEYLESFEYDDAGDLINDED